MPPILLALHAGQNIAIQESVPETRVANLPMTKRCQPQLFERDLILFESMLKSNSRIQTPHSHSTAGRSEIIAH